MERDVYGQQSFICCRFITATLLPYSGRKNSICTHAIPNSIARCLNVNIYWAVTFLQQITVWSSVNGRSFLFKASFSAEKYLFVGNSLINVLCFSSVSKQVCTVFKIQKQGFESQSYLQLWPFCMFSVLYMQSVLNIRSPLPKPQFQAHASLSIDSIFWYQFVLAIYVRDWSTNFCAYTLSPFF